MKKTVVIVGSLALVLACAGIGFSKEVKNVKRKVAQSGASEKVIGSVTAVERTFTLDYDACVENTKFTGPQPRNSLSNFDCEVYVFPDNGEDLELSDFLIAEYSRIGQ